MYLVEHFRVLQLVSPTPVFTAVSQFGHFTAHRQPGIVIGITALGYRFEIVLPDNSNMIRLLRVVSFPVSRTIAVGEGRVKIQIVPIFQRSEKLAFTLEVVFSLLLLATRSVH